MGKIIEQYIIYSIGAKKGGGEGIRKYRQTNKDLKVVLLGQPSRHNICMNQNITLVDYLFK